MLLLLLRSLKHRWFEPLLAALVVAVVVAAFTAQRSLSMSTEDQVHGLAHKLGKNMLVLPSATNPSEFYTMRYGSAAMPDSYPEKIQQSALRRTISLVQSRLYENVEVNEVPLVLVGEETVVRGRVANAESSTEVTIGETAAEQLGLKRFDTLEVAGLPLTIANEGM